MQINRRALLGSAAASAAALPFRRGRAQGKLAVKIGVLTDMSGTYKDLSGQVSVAAARQAVEDFGVAGKNMAVDILSADHQNKPDVAAAIASQWFDRDGVDVILDGTNSGCGLAIAGVAKAKNKIHLNAGAASSDLTGSACNANTVHWVYDTYELAKSTGGSLVKAGGNSWYFLTADYAFGKALQRDTTKFVEGAGGKVLGSSAYPFPGTSDFSSFLLQAQSSGAKVLGLANAGADTVNSIKQAKEFGIESQLAALLLFISDVHALGLQTAQGIAVTSSFYWDANDRTRAWSRRFEPKAPGVRATMTQAGVYSSALHFLKTAEAMGGSVHQSGAATVARMREIPVDDDCFGKSEIRADNRCIHPSYLWTVKKPSESQYPWDYYKLVSSLPADQAFRPIAEGGCSLVKA
ncbi:MAG TPA: ABC transporter substrate-binding protein [Acetobacteraceae bacterium]|nr:ABC transporter substrate-binding protein [Acetobacteraceae bacterium]